MYEDILVIGTLILLEGLLSADNALVLAVLVRHLDPPLRQRALLYGVAGAFVLRFVALLSAVWIIKFWPLRGLGALYLTYICLAHFIRQRTSHAPLSTHTGFWKTVFLIESTDLAFAVDSVLVAVGLSKKLWVIYTGVVIGMIAMRFAAGVFVGLLDRMPVLEHVAYLLVGWISVKLFFGTYELFSASVWNQPFEEHLLPSWLFWSVTGAIITGGLVYGYLQGQKKQLIGTSREKPI